MVSCVNRSLGGGGGGASGAAGGGAAAGDGGGGAAAAGGGAAGGGAAGGGGGGDGNAQQLFIGLLDVFGFECFATNSFEQLCINFANEKLQQFFLTFVFHAEEALYAAEQLRWTRIEYQDNQGCIELLERAPTGLLRLLDEYVLLPLPSGASPLPVGA